MRVGNAGVRDWRALSVHQGKADVMLDRGPPELGQSDLEVPGS